MKTVNIGTTGRCVTAESPWTVVDTEAQFDAALAENRWIQLVGEGTGGVITLTTPKVLPPQMQVRGPAVLQVTFAPGTPSGTTAIIGNNDVVLDNFKLTATHPVGLGTNPFYGIRIPDSTPATGHRMLLKDLEVYNWYRCIIKEGGPASQYVDDIHIEDCYIHTFAGEGILLWFGLRRLRGMWTRVLGRIGSENHATQNAVTLGLNVEDCEFANCEFGNVTRHGYESAMDNEELCTNVRTALRHVRVHDTGGFGVSMGFTQGFFLDDVRVKNCYGTGLELQSRLTKPAWGIARDCWVENLLGGHADIGNYSIGISVDKVIDTTLVRPRIKGVTNTDGGKSFGLQTLDAQRIIITEGDFTDAGTIALFINRNTMALNSGYQVASRNSFHNTFALPNSAAMYVIGNTVRCSHNTSWQKTGTNLNFIVAGGAEGGIVHCDTGTPVTAAGAVFAGSNQVITVP